MLTGGQKRRDTHALKRISDGPLPPHMVAIDQGRSELVLQATERGWAVCVTCSRWVLSSSPSSSYAGRGGLSVVMLAVGWCSRQRPHATGLHKGLGSQMSTVGL
jgi:hypothetical protein